jgi:hypothetical protein
LIIWLPCTAVLLTALAMTNIANNRARRDINSDPTQTNKM